MLKTTLLSASSELGSVPTCMVSIRIEMTSIIPGGSVILIQSLPCPLVNTRIVLTQPVPVSHFPSPVLIHQLDKTTLRVRPKVRQTQRQTDFTVK